MSYIVTAILLSLSICTVTLFSGHDIIIAEEGQHHTWKLTSTSPLDKIEFLVNREQGFEVITRCYYNDLCDSQNGSVEKAKSCGDPQCFTNDSMYHQSLTCDRVTGVHTVQLEIKAVNRSMSYWKVEGKYQNCSDFRSDTHNITVYVKPESPQCDQPVFTHNYKHLSLNCSTDRVYPLADCRLIDTSSVKINYTLLYRRGTSDNSKIDYYVVCTFILDIENIQPIEVNTVLIYAVGFSPVANVEVNTDQVGINLTLPSANVSTDCPKYIIANINATCTCWLTYTGSPSGQAYWYSKDVAIESHDLGDGSAVLNLYFNSSVPNPVYYCSSKSVVGRQLKHVVYKPEYVSGDVNLITIGSTDYTLSSEKSISIFCNFSLNQHTPTSGSISINNITVASIVSSDSISNYVLFYSFQPSIAGLFDVKCVFLDQMGLTLLAERQTVLNVSGNVYSHKDMLWMIPLAVIGATEIICLIIIIKQRLYIRQDEVCPNYGTFIENHSDVQCTTSKSSSGILSQSKNILNCRAVERNFKGRLLSSSHNSSSGEHHRPIIGACKKSSTEKIISSFQSSSVFSCDNESGVYTESSSSTSHSLSSPIFINQMLSRTVLNPSPESVEC